MTLQWFVLFFDAGLAIFIAYLIFCLMRWSQRELWLVFYFSIIVLVLVGNIYLLAVL